MTLPPTEFRDVQLDRDVAIMDAARRIGEDLGRLAEAQPEVDDAMGRRPATERTPTPA